MHCATPVGSRTRWQRDWRRLDDIHRFRNRFDYGDIVDVSEGQVEAIIADAQALLDDVLAAFRSSMHHAEASAGLLLIADLEALTERNTPSLRSLRRAYSKQWKGESPQFVLGVARQLSASGYRWIGCELIRNHPAAFAALNDRAVAQLAVGLNSWDSVDAFARILSGPAWAHGRISDGLIERWSRSRDRWLRRAAIVSTVALNMRSDGGEGDTRRTLAICRRLAADQDDMVQKAISWALRSLVACDGAAVAKFLATHREQLSSRVKREVSNKLRIGLKNPRRTRTL